MIGMATLELGVVFVMVMIVIEGKLDVSMLQLFSATIMLLTVLAFLELFAVYIFHDPPTTIAE